MCSTAFSKLAELVSDQSIQRMFHLQCCLMQSQLLSSNFFLKNRRKKLPTSKPRNDLHDSQQYKISQDKLAPLIVRLSFGLESVSAFVKVKMKTNTKSAMLSKSAAKKLKKKLQSTATKRKPIKATNAVVSAVPDLNLETL